VDAFTMDMRLCDDEGMVDGEYVVALNRLRSLSHLDPFKGAPFACTGSAHLAGEHIRCTSPAHSQVVGKPLNGWQVATTADALPERPEAIAEPLPEDLERLLRDPAILTPHDHATHFWLAEYLSRHSENATVSREAYLGLWALYERECAK
jgi:hypothetical protein